MEGSEELWHAAKLLQAACNSCNSCCKLLATVATFCNSCKQLWQQLETRSSLQPKASTYCACKASKASVPGLNDAAEELLEAVGVMQLLAPVLLLLPERHLPCLVPRSFRVSS